MPPPPAESPDTAAESAEEVEDADFGLPRDAKPLSEILAALAAEGYGPVVEVELEDGAWEIEVYKDGKRLELIADAVSGAIVPQAPPESGKPLAEILEAVEAAGYNPVLDVEADDDGWEIEALKDGRPVFLVVDPETGEITEEE